MKSTVTFRATWKNSQVAHLAVLETRNIESVLLATRHREKSLDPSRFFNGEKASIKSHNRRRTTDGRNSTNRAQWHVAVAPTIMSSSFASINRGFNNVFRGPGQIDHWLDRAHWKGGRCHLLQRPPPTCPVTNLSMMLPVCNIAKVPLALSKATADIAVHGSPGAEKHTSSFSTQQLAMATLKKSLPSSVTPLE